MRIPNEEHRTFHLTVFKRLENPFVMGILEAYWDAYNAVELNRYSDYSYLQQVWTYHERIFEAICAGDYDRAKALFIDHTNLIRFQPRMQRIQAAAGNRKSSKGVSPSQKTGFAVCTCFAKS